MSVSPTPWYICEGNCECQKIHARQAASGCVSVAVCLLCTGGLAYVGWGVCTELAFTIVPPRDKWHKQGGALNQTWMTLEAGRMGAKGETEAAGRGRGWLAAAGASVLDAFHRQTVLKAIPPTSLIRQTLRYDLAFLGGGMGGWVPSHRH